MERIGDSKEFTDLMSTMFKKRSKQFSNYGISEKVFNGINTEPDKETRMRLKSYYHEYARQISGKHVTEIYEGQKLKKAYKSYPVMDSDGNLQNEVSTVYNPKNPDQILFSIDGTNMVYELTEFESGGIKIKCLVLTDKKIYHDGKKEKCTMPDDIFSGSGL